MSGIAGLAALALIAAACAGVADETTTQPTAPATTQPAPPTTQLASPTTQPAPPSTEVDSGTFPPGVDTFEVVGVEPDDVLNVRSGPSTQNDVIGGFPHNYSGVVTTGTRATTSDGAKWWEVEFFDDAIGWVNSAFLGPVAPTSAPFSAYSCGIAPADYVFSGLVATSPASASTADHVFSIDHSSHPDCERTVITLGADYDFNDDPAGTLSPTGQVPGGIQVTNEGPFFNVDLAAIELVRIGATESDRDDDGVEDVFVVNRAGSDSLYLNGHFDHNLGVLAFFLSDPARIVVDTISAPTDTGLAVGPVVGDLAVLSSPIVVDVFGPPPAPPVTVAGYARPFEAILLIRLRQPPAPGADPGTGAPVAATFSGSSFLGTITDSQYAVTTTDWALAWGEFEFTIDALPAGTYELFVGCEAPTEPPVELGVYHEFTVGPPQGG